LLISLLLSGCAAVQEQLPPAPSASDAERTTWIQQVLDQGQGNARLWFEGWVIAQGALAAGQTLLSVKVGDRHFRQDMLIGAAESFVGLIGLLTDPMVPATAADQLRALPESTGPQRRLKLEEAERLLRESAEREARGRGWLQHALAVGVCAAGGVLIVLAWDRPWTDGLIDLGTCLAVAEAQILTQPYRAEDDWERYQQRILSTGGSTASPSPSGPDARWFVAPFPGGLAAAVRF
jgi:hypothetical protein